MKAAEDCEIIENFIRHLFELYANNHVSNIPDE
jgi:hypothetical protein